MAIKNLGMSLIDKIIKERETNGKYTSLYDFCLRNHSREFNRRALEGLIKSGALDCVSCNRREMLYNMESVLTAVENERRYSSGGQLDLFDDMDESSGFVMENVPEMSKDTKLMFEKEVTGLYLSGHPMDDYKGYLKSAKLDSIADIQNGKYPDGKRVNIGGIISGLKVRQLKNNNLLCSFKIEDFDSSVNVTVFGNAYEMYKPVLTAGKPIIMSGRISEHEDRELEIVFEKCRLIPDEAKSMTAPKYKSGLYLKIPNTTHPLFTKVKEILARYNGDSPVYIICVETNKKLEAPKNLYISFSDELIDELSDALGEKNIKYIN
jgi:DNA polymerase-3 subunit alpha